jgi:hypothetical protein
LLIHGSAIDIWDCQHISITKKRLLILACMATTALPGALLFDRRRRKSNHALVWLILTLENFAIDTQINLSSLRFLVVTHHRGGH